MPTSDFIPDISSVGAILRARTRDTNSNEVGTFTAQTRPTGDQVLSMLSAAAEDLASAVGTEDLPVTALRAARTVVTYRAAMLVELSYFPEQVAAGRSPYAQLSELYAETLATLRNALEQDGVNVPDPVTPGAGGGATLNPDPPSWAFPVTSLDPYYIQPWSGGLFQ